MIIDYEITLALDHRYHNILPILKDKLQYELDIIIDELRETNQNLYCCDECGQYFDENDISIARHKVDNDDFCDKCWRQMGFDE